ncbi:hypothetical protein NE857_09165 [Nocardiopsis exhalans]|uniref:Uncharacterized protein n=1 Tax=Nocardiopsis exhalans TaxID=163604 RepID=A0ABY5DBM4_9ACTN|nr:hypothetical protein [Nocardiopsis exhalans]USY21751.1 hypothetical protein NE857_09165 [Nocardiopsis exhalans]
MAKVRYEMDEHGTARLFNTPQIRKLLRRRAETGADAARTAAPEQRDQITTRDGGTGTGTWSDRASAHVIGPAPLLYPAVDAIEAADR